MVSHRWLFDDLSGSHCSSHRAGRTSLGRIARQLCMITPSSFYSFLRETRPTKMMHSVMVGYFHCSLCSEDCCPSVRYISSSAVPGFIDQNVQVWIIADNQESLHLFLELHIPINIRFRCLLKISKMDSCFPFFISLHISPACSKIWFLTEGKDVTNMRIDMVLPHFSSLSVKTDLTKKIISKYWHNKALVLLILIWAASWEFVIATASRAGTHMWKL